jgi:hypothetical protein
MVAPLDLQIQHLELWVSGNDKEKRKQFCEAIEMARLRGEIDFLWSATLGMFHVAMRRLAHKSC